MKKNVPSRKKIPFEISPEFSNYLRKCNRGTKLPLQYGDLLQYEASIPLYNEEGKDTLWETVFFAESAREEINNSLVRIYALLKTDGDEEGLEHLSVARIDFCQFGNTKPFRVRIINRLNDNYDHFYVKQADANRIYGLELEYLLAPNRLLYLFDRKTLIEEHIPGIPGDDFFEREKNISPFNQIRIAKEFIKFNERCFIRLLGDMRAYNYVIDITPDIEGNQYRMRAIDFDQQSYEGRKNFYLPQYFKENNPIVFLGIGSMTKETVHQYQLEERSLVATRIKASRKRLRELIDVMIKDTISFPEKVNQLKHELAKHHKNKDYLKCQNMGEIVLMNIQLLIKKDFRKSTQFGEFFNKT
ncbi:MAG: hypothetical protein NXI23_19085 [Bacteroidetes bacterium]|jgi:hypothetical protein|nr:hypothetical protein [Bacteroidota bacterium]MDF1864314.1 hypothetical protein [Saprospiraceae bacterium]